MRLLLHPGRLTAGTYKSPIFSKGKWPSKPPWWNVPAVNLQGCSFPGCFKSSSIPPSASSRDLVVLDQEAANEVPCDERSKAPPKSQRRSPRREGPVVLAGSLRYATQIPNNPIPNQIQSLPRIVFFFLGGGCFFRLQNLRYINYKQLVFIYLALLKNWQFKLGPC